MPKRKIPLGYKKLVRPKLNPNCWPTEVSFTQQKVDTKFLPFSQQISTFFLSFSTVPENFPSSPTKFWLLPK
jgi:hypothetical protein